MSHLDYETIFHRSKAAYERGLDLFPNGVPQERRMAAPFPPYVASCAGAYIETIDGVRLTDYWQGHGANLFGHNPQHAISALVHTDTTPHAQLGFATLLDQEVASRILQLTHGDQILLCTSGAQATMTAIMLGLAKEKRRLVAKAFGGWHGLHPWSLTALGEAISPENPFEYDGLPAEWASAIVATPYNDSSALTDLFKTLGNELGALILEPVLAVGGMEIASPSYLAEARRLCDHYGTVLIFDEIITGFRCNIGPFSDHYGTSPDLATYGKVLGGGMPFAAVVGKTDVMRQVTKRGGRRVLGDSGTYTAHPATLKVVLANLAAMTEVGQEGFTSLCNRAQRLREGLQRLFDCRSIDAVVTGTSPDSRIPSFPIMTVRPRSSCLTAGATLPASSSSVLASDEVSRRELSMRGHFVWRGVGSVTLAHTDSDTSALISTYEQWINEATTGLLPTDEPKKGM